MIKAVATDAKGRTILFIGLSHANLDELRRAGLNGCIKVNSKDGFPVDLIITAAPTEMDITNALIGGGLISDETKVHIDPKLKS